MRFVFPDAREWKYIVESLASLVYEAGFVASPDGLRVRALEPGRVAMVDLYMPRDLFEEYTAEQEERIGVVLGDIVDVLKRVRPGENVAFEATKEHLTIALTGKAEKKFRFPLLDLPGQEVPSLKLNFTVTAKMPSDTFRDALRDVSLMSGEVSVKAEDTCLWLTGKSDKGEAEARLSVETGSLIEIDVEEPTEASYAAKFLDEAVSKACKVSRVLDLRFATDGPLEMRFDIAGGGTLRYFVAPRVR